MCYSAIIGVAANVIIGLAVSVIIGLDCLCHYRA